MIEIFSAFLFFFIAWGIAWLFGYAIADALITKLKNDSDDIREIIKELRSK